MSNRTVRQLIRAQAITEGAGVTVHRTLGTTALRHLDPFLLLDHFGSDDPDQYSAGFPAHPHRGFTTFTYMLDGQMLHQDSMGNRGVLHAGGAQWMKAASGVIHSEMPQQHNGLMRGFQLWINLPASEKMSDPAYQEFSPEAIPELRDADKRIRILLGAYAGQRGVIEDPYTDVQYLDITLESGRTFSHTLRTDDTAFVYVFEGRARLGDTLLLPHCLAVLSPGNVIEISTDADGARFILVSGQPLHQPSVQHGPFVMTTQEEIAQALRDYRDNTLVRKKAAVRGI